MLGASIILFSIIRAILYHPQNKWEGGLSDGGWAIYTQQGSADWSVDLVCFYNTIWPHKGQFCSCFSPLETRPSGLFSAKPRKVRPSHLQGELHACANLDRASSEGCPHRVIVEEVQKGAFWEGRWKNRATRPALFFWFPNLTGLLDLAQTSAGSIHDHCQLRRHFRPI